MRKSLRDYDAPSSDASEPASAPTSDESAPPVPADSPSPECQEKMNGKPPQPPEAPEPRPGPPSVSSTAAVDYALTYLSHNWSICPIAPGTKAPPRGWSLVPYLSGEKRMTADEARAYWTAHPDHGIAIIMGAPSEINALDYDPRNGADLEVAKRDSPTELVAQTGGGGLHRLYKHPGGHIPKGRTERDGVDRQSDGSYIVAAPSVHPDTGMQYEWLSFGEPGEMPEWALRTPAPGPGAENGDGQGEHWIANTLKNPPGVLPGTQHETLTRLAWYYSGIVPEDIASVELERFARDLPLSRGPWTDANLAELLRSAYQKRAAQGYERGFSTHLPPGAGQGGAEPVEIQLIPDDEFERRPPPEFLIDEILPVGVDAKIVGDSGSGKSFFGGDMALSMGTGTPFLGKFPVKHGSVVYILSEGAGGFSKRIRAWKKEHGFDGFAGVYVLDGSVQLLGRTAPDVQGLLAKIRALPEKPIAIIVDTQNRCMEGRDENSGVDMGLFTAAMSELRKATGATTIAIHHTGWEGKRERGHSSQRGAADTVLYMDAAGEKIGTGAPIKLSCHKQKDYEEFKTMTLVAKKVDLGVDHKGRPLDSLVLELREDVQTELPANALDPLHKAALSVLAGVGARGVLRSELRDAIHQSPDKMKRLVPDLEERGWVKVEGENGRKQTIFITPAGREVLLAG